MNIRQHKIISNIIITAITFLGFESLAILVGLDQIYYFGKIAFYLFLFHIFWVTFVYDLHLKNTHAVSVTSVEFRHLLLQAFSRRLKHFYDWDYLRHYLNYLILPTILFWSLVVLLLLNPFFVILKQVMVLAGTIALVFTYNHLKEHVSNKLFAHHGWLKLLSVIKLLAAFGAFSATLGFCWYFGLNSILVFYFVMASTFFLIHQALFSYGFSGPRLSLLTIFCAIILGSVSIWVYHNWTFQYFTGALILLALYNTFWGLIHHSLDRTLNSKIVIEYLFLGLVIISIVLASHNFGPRVI